MPSRRRLISPEFFTHPGLYEAEARSGLPLRVAFAGLWTASDRRGLFNWNPKVLKLAVLPYDPTDFENVLVALEQHGFVERYVVDGKTFGRIPSFGKWQTFHKHERPSNIPEPSKGCSESANGCREPDNGRPDTSITVAVAVAGTVTSTVAVAGSVETPAAPTTAATREAKPQNSDPVELLLGAFEFGAFADSVAGLCRSAKNGYAVVQTLRMHIAGEMGHEKATPLQLGLACQQFNANGKDFNAKYFAGFVKGAKRGAEVVDNRKRADAEKRAIDAEAERRERERLEDEESARLLAKYRERSPQKFAELEKRAEANAPPALSGQIRSAMVRSSLLQLIRGEAAV